MSFITEVEGHYQIPHGIVSRLESGEQAYPSVPVAMRLARVLGVSVDYLIGMYEDDESEQFAAAVSLASV
jgi:transcriptional regulator with XRE-family HTH domain